MVFALHCERLRSLPFIERSGIEVWRPRRVRSLQMPGKVEGEACASAVQYAASAPMSFVQKSRFTDSHRGYVRTRTEIRRGSSPLCRSSADGRRAFSMPKQEQIRQGILWRRGCGVWMGQPAVRHLNFKFEANRDINAENSCIIFGTTIYTSLPRTKWYIQDQSLWKNRRIPIGRF